MFYCVFLTFPLKTNSSVALRSGLGGFMCNLWLPRPAPRQQTLSVLSSAVLIPSSGMFFFPFPDSFSLPLWWMPTCCSRPNSSITVVGKHLPSSPPWFLPSVFIPVSYGSCHLGVVGCYVCEDLCSLGNCWSLRPCLSCLWITSTLLNIELWFTLSLGVNHNGRKICLRWVCC